jgi:hypothetical protein
MCLPRLASDHNPPTCISHIAEIAGVHNLICIFFSCVVLGFELRAYTLSHSASPF